MVTDMSDGDGNAVRARSSMPAARRAFCTSAQSHSEDSQRRQDVGYWAMVWGMERWHNRMILSAAERQQLAAIAADRNRPREHVERARIVRLSGSALAAAGSAQRAI